MASPKLLIVYHNLFADSSGGLVRQFKQLASQAATDPQPFKDLLTHLSGDPNWSPTPYEIEAFGYVMNRDVNASVVRPWDDSVKIGEGW